MQSENVNITLQDLPNFMRYITTFDSILTILWLKKTPVKTDCYNITPSPSLCPETWT